VTLWHDAPVTGPVTVTGSVTGMMHLSLPLSLACVASVRGTTVTYEPQ